MIVSFVYHPFLDGPLDRYTKDSNFIVQEVPFLSPDAPPIRDIHHLTADNIDTDEKRETDSTGIGESEKRDSDTAGDVGHV